MREAASRGFWISSHAPFGYNRVMVPDGPKKRPTLETNPDTSRIVKRIFDMAEAAKGTLEITRILNNEGIASPRGKLWGKTSVHGILINEAYTGTLVWGAKAKDEAEPVRVEKGVSRHRLQGPVPPCQPAHALPRTQVQPPPKGSEAPTCSAA